MNTQLKTLFTVYKIRKKDRHEIRQIFSLLSPEKKIIFLERFPQHAETLRKIYRDIENERQILLGDAFKQVDAAILKVKQDYPS